MCRRVLHHCICRYINETLWDGTRPENYFQYYQLELRNMSSIIFHAAVTPGPLKFRRVLASAVISDPDNTESKFTLYMKPHMYTSHSRA
jgi:hypothetical protein